MPEIPKKCHKCEADRTSGPNTGFRTHVADHEPEVMRPGAEFYLFRCGREIWTDLSPKTDSSILCLERQLVGANQKIGQLEGDLESSHEAIILLLQEGHGGAHDCCLDIDEKQPYRCDEYTGHEFSKNVYNHPAVKAAKKRAEKLKSPQETPDGQ